MSCLSIPLLAVDGGGTKCQAVFVDQGKRIVASGLGGSCNYHGSGREAAAAELYKSILATIEDWKRRQGYAVNEAVCLRIECAFMGLAGLDTKHDRQIIEAMVKEVVAKLPVQIDQLVVENDGLAALLGATQGKAGILAIAGTGSITFGINSQGVSARAGGWGHRVGDEGSGYWIGKQAITAILQAADGRAQPTGLDQYILPHLGLNDVEELFDWVYSSRYSIEQVAELARLVSQAALSGDAVAKQLLCRAGEQLFFCLRAVIDRLGLRQEDYVYFLQGGVLQNEQLVRDIVMQRITGYSPNAREGLTEKEPIAAIINAGLSRLEKTNGRSDR
ncbi:N-acetylglucosamine kinase [Brevibacillus fulvus]|uniref:N-acetylglucosamine kinase-like BadF-type ATPase n=1 Tax=Brevibacillus fulvus TaxID=1125967 RepID=A0A938Y1H6_9BACL|nr:BadF/BadG/BcrA/BcrD ATPase family protein [Brevibacillus fulvus]MBM7590684.1 N-acetylglucosamine kinase-like BadF-type ATPase [Brevibacillus fulvus]